MLEQLGQKSLVQLTTDGRIFSKCAFRALLNSVTFLIILIAGTSNSDQSLGNKKYGWQSVWERRAVGIKRSSLLRREKEKLSALQLSLFSHTLLKILGRSPCTTYLLINWSLKNITKESKGRILLCLKSGKVCELYLLEVTIIIAFFCLRTSSFRLLCAVELHIWMPKIRWQCTNE